MSDITVELEWRPVEASQRMWQALSWHGSYSVWEHYSHRGRWNVCCGYTFAVAFDFATALAVAEMHNDLHLGEDICAESEWGGRGL